MVMRDPKRKGLPPEQKKEQAKEVAELSGRAAEMDKKVIDLSPEKLKIFSGWIKKRVDDCISNPDRVEGIERVKQYRIDYEKGVQRTTLSQDKGWHDFRSREASAQSDAIKGRIVTFFQDNPIFKFEGRNTQGVKNAPVAESFMDYHHDVNNELPAKGNIIADILSVDGHGVLHTPWEFEVDTDFPELIEERKYSKDGKEQWFDVNSKVEMEAAREGQFVEITPPEFRVTERRTTKVVKNYPGLEIYRIEDACWSPGVKPCEEIPMQGVRKKFTYERIRELEEAGKFYKGTADSIKSWLAKRDDQPEQEKSINVGTQRKSQDVARPAASYKDEDILDFVLSPWVMYGKMKIPGEKNMKDCVALYHAESKTVLQVKFNENYTKKPNVFHLRLLEVHWRFLGIGIMELTRDFEKYGTDIFNYALDYTRVLSAIPLTIKKAKMPNGIQMQEFMKGLLVDAHADVQAFNLPDRRGVDIALIDRINAFKERRTSITDSHQGRVSDQKNTATEFIQVMAESQVKFGLFNYTFILSMIKMAEHQLQLFVQFGSEKLVDEVTDGKGKELFPNSLSKSKLLGRYKIFANVNAQKMVRELDAQIVLHLYNLMKDNPYVTGDNESFYNMTKDVFDAMGRKRHWMKPYAYYAKKTGEAAQFTAKESMLIDRGLDAGLAKEQIEMELESLRAGKGSFLLSDQEEEMSDEDKNSITSVLEAANA